MPVEQHAEERPHEAAREQAQGIEQINTAITQAGGKVDAGFFVDKRDRQTRKVRWEQLDEVLAYDAGDLDRDVVAPDQIRTVLATFRADIDVATCGVISPLKALNYLIESLESDIVVMDYRVRGFTRDVKGRKHYIDHKINSIQDYLAKNIKARYEMLDVNVYQENLFHTKMHLKEFDLDNYLFEEKAKNLSFKERMKIEARLRREIEELYEGRNLVE